MSKHMERDLDRLHRAVMRMAAAVEEAVFRATSALQSSGVELAREVIKNDHEIDRLENEVQDDCLKILALHQPVAVDLRRVSSVLLIATDLERIGDLAVSIAERVIVLAHPPYPTIPDRFSVMTHRTTTMLRHALDSFVHLDTSIAESVILLDDKVDEDNDLLIEHIMNAMQTDSSWIETGLSLFSAVRHLERIADHATNIAEDVIYLAKGEVVRHHLGGNDITNRGISE